MKTKSALFPILASLAFFALSLSSNGQDQPVEFKFPPGVDWSNAAPDQIADAVYNAVKASPDAAVQVAALGLQYALQTGRWSLQSEEDSQNAASANSSSGVPTVSEIANLISDAASRANPAMAPQIQAVVSDTLSSLAPAIIKPLDLNTSGGKQTIDPDGSSGGGAVDGSSGGSGAGAPPPSVAPIPGGGGRGGPQLQPASN